MVHGGDGGVIAWCYGRWLVGEDWTQFRAGVNVAGLRAVLEALPPDSEVGGSDAMAGPVGQSG